ncbi:MAG: hypothetical protein WEF51_04015 [Chloroflexota bacterium]
MTFFNKLNANERLVAIGAVIVIISSLVGMTSALGSLVIGSVPLIAAIAVLVIYYLKYSGTQSVTWPMPVQTIVLAISAIAAVLAIVGALPGLAFIATLYGISLIGTLVGAAIMAWGAWQDYQAMPKTTPPSA